MAKEKETGEQNVCINRQARHNYFIEETYEAGLILLGSEVKCLRDGKANLYRQLRANSEGRSLLSQCSCQPLSGSQPV